MLVLGRAMLVLGRALLVLMTAVAVFMTATSQRVLSLPSEEGPGSSACHPTNKSVVVGLGQLIAPDSPGDVPNPVVGHW